MVLVCKAVSIRADIEDSVIAVLFVGSRDYRPIRRKKFIILGVNINSIQSKTVHQNWYSRDTGIEFISQRR